MQTPLVGLQLSSWSSEDRQPHQPQTQKRGLRYNGLLSLWGSERSKVATSPQFQLTDRTQRW
jgi:hypothetical protein